MAPSFSPTKRDRVVLYLLDRAEQWVPGWELATPEVGGSEGLRRLREARNDGWPIEGRQITGSNSWEYRILPGDIK